MICVTSVIFQNPANPARVLAGLSELISDPTVERLRVAVAYANSRGVQALHALLNAANEHISVEVIVTLDMGITRKAALEYLLRDFGGATRTISTPLGVGTFHPKAFVTDRHELSERALLGSANLTDAALTRNHEAVSISDLTIDQAVAWEHWWAELVAGSSELSERVITEYVERTPQPGAREYIADEDLETQEDGSVVLHRPQELDASDGQWLVIDWGGTGEYRVQFEFPKAAAAFFRPDPSAERQITLRLGGHLFRDNQLTFYPDNGMARINLDQRIPAVSAGSIKEHTSEFVRCGGDDFELRLIGDVERARRLTEATLVGGTGYTRRRNGTLREFGWA